MNFCCIELTKNAQKDLIKIPGFHDEPLKGNRKGQRSIRLNRAYRAIYTEDQRMKVHIISIIEVNKHAY